MTRAPAMFAASAVFATGVSAAGAAPAVVHGYTGEVRACLPLEGGGALVGTGGGLVRVDGRGATQSVWTARDGLPGTRIEMLVRDGDAVWVGADEGAARIEVGDTLSVGVKIGGGQAVRDVVRFGGAMYGATYAGVRKVGARGGAGVIVPIRGGARGPASRVAALAATTVDGRATLWAGTAGGLFELRGGRFEPVAIEGLAAGAAVTDLLGDGDKLWIATADGLFVREADTVRKIGGGELRQVAKIGGHVVVAGLGDGLRKVDRGRLVVFDAPRGLVLAQAIGTGDDGAICAGGLDGLWLRGGDAAAWTAATMTSGLPSNDVSALAVDGERLWVGTFDQGLVVRERGAWRKVAHADLDARINALLVEPRAGKASRVWVATAAGLMILDGASVTRLARRDGMPGRGVLALARLRDGRVVAGTSTGAVIIDGARPVPVGPSGSDVGNVWAVAEDADGMLWLGTTTGVWRGPSAATAKAGDRDAGWTRMSVATGHLADDWIMAIAVRGRGVWVGGYKGGVVRFDLDDLAHTTKLDGGWINPGGLAWDGDTLVASTQEGLRRGDGATATWTTETGMPGKDVTAVARTGTTRWIATRRGLVELR